MFNNVLFVLKQEYTYQLNPPHSLSIHSTLAIFILSTRPRKMTVDMFPQKKNPGIQATRRRLSEYPEILYSKPFFTIYFCTFDNKTTVSTWHERITSTSNPLLGMRKLIDRHFAISSVYGNISMMII